MTQALRKVENAIINSKPRTHSYGFAQIYLNDVTRLHLFDGEICARACIPDQVSVRHNHRYDFKSTVLGGCVIDAPCEFVPSDVYNSLANGNTAWRRWEVQPAHEGETGIKPTADYGFVVEGTPGVYKAGMSYRMKAGDYHATSHIGTTVSLFQRKNVAPIWSSLIVPPGFSPEHSLTKQPSADWLQGRYLDAVSELSDDALEFLVLEAEL